MIARAHLWLEPRHLAARFQFDGIQVVIAVFEGEEARVIIGHPLRGRQEKHRRNFTGRLAVLRILGNADNFEFSGMFHVDIAEMIANRIAILEKFLGERLVHHRDVLRDGRILIADRAPLNYFGADRFKVAVAHAQPGRVVLIGIGFGRRLALDVNGLAPVVALHRAVQRKTHLRPRPGSRPVNREAAR